MAGESAAVGTGLGGQVAAYAQTFHDVIGYRHHIASPLGAWLLLALCGPAADGEDAGGEDAGREDAATLARLLGGDRAAAAEQAATLLGNPPPVVGAAAGVWTRAGAGGPGWLDDLPAAVSRGAIPPPPELDAWAREHTFGLIDKFPVVIGPAVALVLATALATKVSWDCPFELAPAVELGPASPWSGQVARVLRSPVRPGHAAFIAATDDAGDVAVHLGQARDGLLVASVIAGPEVEPSRVLVAAHRIAIARALGQPVPSRSLLDLPLGDGPLWSIREEAASGGGPAQRCYAVLPAWSAQDSFSLTDPRLGFAAVARSLGGGDRWQARQAATAAYSRTGFEAAAVTAMAVALAMRPGGRRRVAELRFGHPYGVVAVTTDGGSWRGVPVFSGWVTEPVDA
jgi:hypothetical protein